MELLLAFDRGIGACLEIKGKSGTIQSSSHKPLRP